MLATATCKSHIAFYQPVMSVFPAQELNVVDASLPLLTHMSCYIITPWVRTHHCWPPAPVVHDVATTYMCMYMTYMYMYMCTCSATYIYNS